MRVKDNRSTIKDREESVTKNAHPCDNWEIKFAQALFHRVWLVELIYKYLNRLSDYLFVLSRKITFDLKAVETPWKPRL